MKISKKQLKEMVREAVKKEITASLKEDYMPGKYKAPHEVVDRYSKVMLKKLGLADDMKARMTVVNTLETAVRDAWQAGQE